MRAAIGYALGEDAIGLARFRERYLSKMGEGPDARAFEVVTAPIEAAGTEFTEIARSIAAVDTLEAFLRDLRARYPETGAAPSAQRAEPSRRRRRAGTDRGLATGEGWAAAPPAITHDQKRRRAMRHAAGPRPCAGDCRQCTFKPLPSGERTLKVPAMSRAFLGKSFIALAIGGTAVATASAQDGWSYKNRTVTIYSAGTAGGGYDFYARLLARHIGRHLPGNPAVVVKNMPGAGGVVLANHLQTRAARDGTEFAALEHGTAFTPLLTHARVDFDPAKFGWLGSMEQFTPIAAVWHTVPIYSADDLMADVR